MLTLKQKLKHRPRPLSEVCDALSLRGLHVPAEPLMAILSFIMQGERAKQDGQPNALAIVGPPGSGKSFLVQQAAMIAGVHVFRFSLAECESSLAGKPTEQFRRVAQQVQRIEDSGDRGIIVIEDVECGIASPRPGEGSSTNRPQIQGVIQELLDGTHAVDGRVLSPKRMLFTSNDLSQMRSSLIRESRCMVLRYNPSRKERAKIAAQSLRSVVPPEVIHGRACQLSRLSVAEIIAVREELRQHTERFLVFDLSWRAYVLWNAAEGTSRLVDAVAKRVLGRNNLRHTIKAVRRRAKLRRASFL